MARLAAFGLAAAVGSSAAAEPAFPSAPYDWSLYGPWIAPIADLASDPADGDRLLAGTSVGAFLSHDGGRSWLPLGRPLSSWLGDTRTVGVQLRHEDRPPHRSQPSRGF